MKKLLKTADVREIIDNYNREEITYSRMVEMLNERANEALALLNISGNAQHSTQITKSAKSCDTCIYHDYKPWSDPCNSCGLTTKDKWTQCT